MLENIEIEKAFKGTRFGPDESIKYRRAMLAKSIFKLICGYRTGHTVACILTELGVTTNNYGVPKKAAKTWAYHEVFPTGHTGND